ncbi:MAG: dihydrodipicolinate reductase [Acidimicrobiia bacterium]
MPLRVIQWATGNIGRRSLAGALQHPDLEVVGVRVFSPAKVGVDAGTLAGLPVGGVAATDDVDALVALGADCVLHMPSSLDIDELSRLLASGANVVSTRSELVHARRALPDDAVDRLEAACAEGGSSLYGTGSSPGFITDVLPVALLLVERSLHTLAIEEFADLSQRASPELLFDVMGMGRRPAPVDARRADHLRGSFAPSLESLADRIGLHINRTDAHAEVAVASRPVTIAAGDIEEGCIAAQRTTITAMTGDDTRLMFRATWYCTTFLEPAWSLGATGWRVTVDGDAPMTVDVAFPVEIEQLGDVTPGYTANPAVNAVAAVCAARPGLVTAADLLPIAPRIS